MSSLLSIRHRITALLAPWTSSKQKSPFSEVELFAMALLVAGRPMTEKVIFEWIFEHVGYCRQLAYESFYGGQHYPMYPEPAAVGSARNLRIAMSNVLGQHDFPVEITVIGGVAHYSMSAANGHRVLAHALGLNFDRKQSFPFFRLPAELRNTIYELVFQYPKSGLHITGRNSSVARVLTRSTDEDVSFNVAGRQHRILATAPIEHILAPLLVSRQLHQETLPFFYNSNKFYFGNHQWMHEVLSKIPDAHRDHIKHVSFTYQLYDSRDAVAHFTTLGKLQGLRKLEVHLDEERWKEYRTGGKRAVKKYEDIAKVPGLRTLGKIRGLEEVIFHGCPTVERILKEGMLKPKPTRKAAAPRKRKAFEGGEDATANKRGGRAKKGKTS